MYEVVFLALSICGEYGRRRAQATEESRGTLTAAEEAGLVARETGALRRELSTTLKDTLSYRTRIVCLEEQAVILATLIPSPGGTATTGSASGRCSKGE